MRKVRIIDKKEKENLNENKFTEEEINEIKELNDIELEKNSKSNLFNKLHTFAISICSFILRTILFVLKISGIYLLWICLHYFSAHLYIKFCVPNNVIGFIMSPFMIMTPHCQGLRWIVYNAANIINNMWLIIGAWIYSVIWIFGNEKT
jgi:hypothetical protein